MNGVECKPSFQFLVELADEYTPEKTSEITGIEAGLIIKLAEKSMRLKETFEKDFEGFKAKFT